MTDLNDENNIKQQDNNTIFGMPVEEFLDTDILELLGVKNVSGEERDKIYKKMTDTILNRVIARIDDELKTNQHRDEFKKLLKEGDDKKTGEYLHTLGIDVQKMVINEAMIYKTELVSLAKAQENN